MTNKKVTRKALLMSIISLLICISMLMGTTFAWFTDDVTSGVNKIVAGNLDVELYHQNAKVNVSTLVESNTKLFDVNVDGDEILWEPGVIAYETLTVKNVGTLAFQYRMLIAQYGYNSVTRSTETKSLLDVLRVHIEDNTTFSGGRAAAKAKFKTEDKKLGEYLNDTIQGVLLQKDSVRNYTVFIYWPDNNTNDTDNFYNLKNDGWTLDRQLDGKNALYVDLGVTIVAVQHTYENDSFDALYDLNSKLPEATSASTTETVAADKSATLTVPVAPEENKSTTVTLTNANTSGALDTATSAKLDVKTTDVLNSSSYIISGTSSDPAASVGVAATIDLTLTLTKTITDGQSTTTQTAQATSGFTAKVETYVAKNLSGVSIKYNGTSGTFNTAATTPEANEAAVDTVGEYYYNKDTGKLVFITDHFSQYLVGTTSVAYVTRHANNDVEVNTAYDNLADAIAAAGETAPIYLLNDATYTPTEVCEFYVALQGHTITNKSTSFELKEVEIDGGNVTHYSVEAVQVPENAQVLVTKTDNTIEYCKLQEAMLNGDAVTIKLLKDINLQTDYPELDEATSISNIGDDVFGDEFDPSSFNADTYKAITNVTIDLNGHSLTQGNPNNVVKFADWRYYASDWEIKNVSFNKNDSTDWATLTITDTSESKTGHIEGIEITYANLIFDGVKINVANARIVKVNNDKKGNITIKNSTITLTGSSEFLLVCKYAEGNLSYDDNSSISIGANSTLTESYKLDKNAKLSINGAPVNS